MNRLERVDRFSEKKVKITKKSGTTESFDNPPQFSPSLFIVIQRSLKLQEPFLAPLAFPSRERFSNPRNHISPPHPRIDGIMKRLFKGYQTRVATTKSQLNRARVLARLKSPSN